MAANRNAEALDELDKIPADVRRQLEADIEWVQGIASLYVAVGDTPRQLTISTASRTSTSCIAPPLPPALKSSTPGCSTTLKDDVGLYPVLLRLDARPI